MSTDDDRPPWHVELEMFANHLASELGVDEISAPLRRTLDLYTLAVVQRIRDAHEHPTPVVHVDTGAGNYPGLPDGSPQTLPTVPPGSYDDEPPVTGRTSRGFQRAP